MSLIMDYLRNPSRIRSVGFVMIHPLLGKLSQPACKVVVEVVDMVSDTCLKREDILNFLQMINVF